MLDSKAKTALSSAIANDTLLKIVMQISLRIRYGIVLVLNTLAMKCIRLDLFQIHVKM